jgi:hypothetical protein
MEFLKGLFEDEESKMAREIMRIRPEQTVRIFKHFEFKDLALSLQASWGHYCKPRKTLETYEAYAAWEFALIRNGYFVTVSEVLPNFSELTEIEKYEQSVYANVPTELVEKLYLALRDNY